MSIAAERLHRQLIQRRRTNMMLMERRVNLVLEANERGRPYRAVFYALLAGAGAILLTDPTKQLGQAGSIRWIWSSFMIIGTLLSLAGVIRDRWRLEWYGLPLEISSLMGLAYVLVAGGGTTGRLAVTCFVLAPIPVIVHRFIVLYRLYSATKKMIQHDRGEE
jgi:hypothetical protein